MRLIRDVLTCALLAVLIAAAVYGILLIRAVEKTVAAVPAEITATRQALIGEVQGARVDVLVRTERQVAALRTETLAEVAEIRKTADRRIGDTLGRVDTALGTAERVEADLKPVLDGGARLVADADVTVKDLRPQLLGLVAAAKVTAGEGATTMREIQRATPEIIGSVKDATVHIDAATKASAEASVNAAKLTGNLAAATKPLPKGVRLGLQIAGPLAQISSYLILMLSTMGVL